MAGFTPFNRKASLLLAKLGDMGVRDSNTKIEYLGKITLNAVRFWRQSKTEYKHSEKISNWLKSRLDISDKRNLLSNDVSVKEFSVLLGYTIQQGREIIDQAYSALYPTYSIFYSTHRAASDILDRFQGLHLVYRVESGDRVKAFTGHDSNIVQMPLTVRYVIKSTKPALSESFRVRCKLTLPSYTASSPLFEYDGYITPQKYDSHYWLFENRSEENKDLIFMITDSLAIMRRHETGLVHAHDYAQGVMITRRQDDWRRHKTWKIFMLKVNPDDTSDTESTFMTSQCKVVSKHGVDQWIIETLDKPWDGIDLSSLPQETK